MGTLYIVATPIGNLGDISIRAIETLKSVNVILAEDTRVTKKLLDRYEIKKPILRCDEYANASFFESVKERLVHGENIAFVSDAGTPGISDPGSKLVKFLREQDIKILIVPIPGASAITSILSVSGISAGEFTFLGYAPHKKGRETFFKKTKEIEARPVVFYESPFRARKALESLSVVYGKEHAIVVGRELTKIHEDIFSGTLESALLHFKGEKEKGEFVIVIL
ncbi:MAG: 16S rRNA (cytidine(1402)-2'-O)-methyltransferase [Candidatus Jorgensenbacteria bacterium]|nr:16S rRNA (cytidine(1402)-2'-O)-methyltransferase [Candidatus Jorgensenbacteria bacterium]